MNKIKERIICNRCKKEITDVRIRLEPEYLGMYPGQEEILISLRVLKICGKDFCEECTKDIIDFALNKDTCDECIRDMEDNAALLRAADEETEVSPNMEKYRDVMATYLGEPVRRDGRVSDEGEESSRQKEPDSDTTTCSGIDMGQTEGSKTNIQYMVPIEEVTKAMKVIRRDLRYQSGQHQEADPADTHGTLQ